ncbi:CBF/Mak21 family-domain-containing protein [Rhodocollybia butyracea]|uniref:CBF/Mak21 family-domain-containing protein n=1 Tax=Rhodocollybia butyracea TaxID=206335 RepID=A0A9P5Q057_9AGAR|nr:CBF/Mak21 family-domain-containing protein [Rhodocollybia butyracea]
MPAVRSLPPPSKKRKIASSSSKISLLEKQLTSAVSSNGSLNDLVDLTSIALQSNSQAEDASKAIWALYRVWVTVINNGKLSSLLDGNAKVVKAWLWDRLNEYVELLSGLLKDEEKTLRTSALQILFSLQTHLSKAASDSASSSATPQFHVSHFRKIVHALLFCPPSHRSSKFKSSDPLTDGKIDADVLHLFYENWFSVHDDIRWFFLREAGTLLHNLTSQGPNWPKTHPYVPTNALSILEKLTTFPTEQQELNSWWVSEFGKKPKAVKGKGKGPDVDGEDEEDEDKPELKDEDEDDWRKFFDEQDATDAKDKTKNTRGIKGRIHTLTLHQSLHNLSSHRAVFTRAWLNLLSKLSTSTNDDEGRERNKALATRALSVMHRGVLPFLTRPVLVMDWVGACVDYGGTVGLLALNALYELMKEYNLDYPSFYTRLYAFLDRDVLHLKHRARFFRLTEMFLSSTHLPLTLLASFLKRLARLSLNAPPPAIVMIIPFTYNIMKRHPGLMVMIHRDGEMEFQDPFNAGEPNPLLTNALSSSLWELHTHVSHYHTPVSTLAKIFGEVFTKEKYAMEDFLDHGFASLFDAEASRKIKKEPALALELEHQTAQRPDVMLFEGGEGNDIGHGDVVTKLWAF